MKRLLITLFSAGLLWSFASVGQAKYYGKHLCAYEDFTCVQVKKGDTWEKLFPDPKQRDIVKRLNRTNIALHYRSWIVVPNGLDEVDYMTLAPFPENIDPGKRKTLVVDLKNQAFGAYNKSGELVHWGPISGGKDYCADVGRGCRTVAGKFSIIRKQGPECVSSKFPLETNGGAPMKYCMHFYRGYALHAAKLPGFHASHGCVRLFEKDAKWLNLDFLDYGSTVIVNR